MQGERRKFRREGEVARREALIAAALDLVAESGPQAATVRAIADRAGVTPGLIRHYFASKGELTRAAFRTLMERLSEISEAAIGEPGMSPERQLATFVVSSLRPPSVDPEVLTQWAGFIHMIRHDDALRAVHEATYVGYRDRLERLIASLSRTNDPQRLRAQAIACNAVIDGLWLEGSALPDRFAPDDLARLGLASVGAILGVDLMPHAPGDLRPDGGTT
jgi:TetR/AcrR family transcriptional regulator, transcriptional repressor of bet genes